MSLLSSWVHNKHRTDTTWRAFISWIIDPECKQFMFSIFILILHKTPVRDTVGIIGEKLGLQSKYACQCVFIEYNSCISLQQMLERSIHISTQCKMHPNTALKLYLLKNTFRCDWIARIEIRGKQNRIIQIIRKCIETYCIRKMLTVQKTVRPSMLIHPRHLLQTQVNITRPAITFVRGGKQFINMWNKSCCDRLVHNRHGSNNNQTSIVCHRLLF